LCFRPRQFNPFGGPSVLDSAHAADEVERVAINPAILEMTVIDVDSEDFPNELRMML
jgi:hypothetical protein